MVCHKDECFCEFPKTSFAPLPLPISFFFVRVRVRSQFRLHFRVVLFENFRILMFEGIGRMMGISRIMDVPSCRLVVLDGTYVNGILFVDRRVA